MKRWISLIFLLVALPSALSFHYTSPESILYPYGPAYRDQTTPILDDGGSEKIPIRHHFKYFGESHKYLYVNNNGGISFVEPVTEYTPNPFPLPDTRIIAPYWADADNEIHGIIYWREDMTTTILQKVSDHMNKCFPDLHYKAEWSFIATWHELAYFGSTSEKYNTFQAILTTDLHKSFVILIYWDIQWTTGTASDGDPLTGLGGIPAQAGFNTIGHHFSIPNSRTPHIINIKSTSNVDMPGCWIFQVDDFKMTGGCIFEATYMHIGQNVWKDEKCSTKCICKYDSSMACVEEKCNEGLICVKSGRHYMCQINEEDC